jgi:hypothetical protein
MTPPDKPIPVLTDEAALDSLINRLELGERLSNKEIREKLPLLAKLEKMILDYQQKRTGKKGKVIDLTKLECLKFLKAGFFGARVFGTADIYCCGENELRKILDLQIEFWEDASKLEKHKYLNMDPELQEIAGVERAKIPAVPTGTEQVAGTNFFNEKIAGPRIDLFNIGRFIPKRYKELRNKNMLLIKAISKVFNKNKELKKTSPNNPDLIILEKGENGRLVIKLGAIPPDCLQPDEHAALIEASKAAAQGRTRDAGDKDAKPVENGSRLAQIFMFEPVSSSLSLGFAGIADYPEKIIIESAVIGITGGGWGKAVEHWRQFNKQEWGSSIVSNFAGGLDFGFKTWGIKQFAGFSNESSVPMLGVMAMDQLAALALTKLEQKGEQMIKSTVNQPLFFLGVQHGEKIAKLYPEFPCGQIMFPLLMGKLYSTFGDSLTQTFIDQNVWHMRDIANSSVVRGMGMALTPLGWLTPGFWVNRAGDLLWQPESNAGKLGKMLGEGAVSAPLTWAEWKVAAPYVRQAGPALVRAVPALSQTGMALIGSTAFNLGALLTIPLMMGGDSAPSRSRISAGSNGGMALNELAQGKVLSSANGPDCREIPLGDTNGYWTINSIIGEGEETTTLAWETAVVLFKLGHIKAEDLSDAEWEQLKGALDGVDFNDPSSSKRAFEAYKAFLKPSEWIRFGSSRGHKSETFAALLTRAIQKFQGAVKTKQPKLLDRQLNSEQQRRVYGPGTARQMLSQYNSVARG